MVKTARVDPVVDGAIVARRRAWRHLLRRRLPRNKERSRAARRWPEAVAVAVEEAAVRAVEMERIDRRA